MASLNALMPSPVDPAGDAPSNPLLPQPNTVNTADAYTSTTNNLASWLQDQRAQSVNMGLWNPETGMPTGAGITDAARQYAGALVAGTQAPKGLKLPVRPSSEDVFNTMNASFDYGRNVGPRTVDIGALNGGVALDNPAQQARISALVEQMKSPDGYISRPIVDTAGNVVEGQHRLEALRQLGVQKVPVHVIEDLAANVDVDAAQSAIKQAQTMHGDQRKQLLQHVLETVSAEKGSPSAVRQMYKPPPGYAPAWHAALDYLEQNAAK